MKLLTLHVLDPSKKSIHNEIQSLKGKNKLIEEEATKYPQYEENVNRMRNITSLFEEASQVGK